jgi:hypothetical protein
MPKKRLGAEQIVTKLRQVEVLQSQGKSVATACKDVGLTEQSYCRYRKECGSRRGGSSNWSRRTAG